MTLNQWFHWNNLGGYRDAWVVLFLPACFCDQAASFLDGTCIPEFIFSRSIVKTLIYAKNYFNAGKYIIGSDVCINTNFKMQHFLSMPLDPSSAIFWPLLTFAFSPQQRTVVGIGTQKRLCA